MSYWVHDLDPVIIRFTETLAIRWYGVAYVAGFAAFWLLMRLYHRKGRSPYDDARLETLLLFCVLGVFLGGRLGYALLYDAGYYLSNPLQLIKVWEGGMAFHGGVIGVTLGLIFAAMRVGADPFRTGDLVCITVPLGLFFGRMANFINGELWGRVSEAPWAMIFPKAHFDPDQPRVFVESIGQWANPRHPSQLYEAATEGLLLFAYLQFRFWRKSPDKMPPAGQLAGEFLIGYALMRTLCEQFREPDASLILGLTRGTFYSLAMIAGGIALIVYARKRKATQV